VIVRSVLSCASILLAGSLTAFSQIVTVSIPHSSIETKNTGARTAALTPMKLPFWDDFSFTPTAFPHDTLWATKQSVWVNDGIGINPPSIKTGTFDGIDSLGKPYNVNDVTAKGFADKLVSRPLRMDLIDPSLRATMFISFFYQFQGNGEAPDQGDAFSLSFKNNLGLWDVVWSKDNDGTLQKDVFVPIKIAITDPKYFYNGFQFRFQNFARLSGPYDTWNLDYVFVNNGHVSTDPPPFPDRTVVSPLTSLFNIYYAVPLKHFFTNPAAHLAKPTLVLSNRRQDQPQGEGQPVSYSSDAIITTKKNNAVTTVPITLDTGLPIGNDLYYNEKRVLALNQIPAPALFDAQADSIGIQINLSLDTRDNTIKTGTQGDYVPLIYSPIDFRLNDHASKKYTLQDYYAYDDGTAEYGAGLNQPGALLAYKFDMQTPNADTLVAIEMYFPRFGDESSQSIQLSIWKDLLDNPSSLLYQQTVPVTRTELNKFAKYVLTRSVGVKETFYIGWRQTTSTVIGVGLDKNTDSGDHMYFNLNGTWQKNVNVKGSLMMRPVFGKNNGVITGVEEVAVKQMAYPNPNPGTFYVTKDAKAIRLFDMTGQAVDFSLEDLGDLQKLNIQHGSPGIYILRSIQHNQVIVEKIMVQH
jgi:hypothetical protein